jgi:acyl-CoA thioester hydrolase
MQQPFVWQMRVYWEDTDAGGVVYHSRYLNFFERARTEWLRSRGVQQAELAAGANLIFVVRRMEIDFVRAARMDDELEVSVLLERAGRSRMEMSQEMLRLRDGEVLARAAVTAACVDAESFKPMRMPAWLRAEMEEGPH